MSNSLTDISLETGELGIRSSPPPNLALEIDVASRTHPNIYAALGGRRFIGNPKQPTLAIYSLVEGEYQINQFQGSDACGNPCGERILSPALPELNLTAEEIFQAAFA